MILVLVDLIKLWHPFSLNWNRCHLVPERTKHSHQKFSHEYWFWSRPPKSVQVRFAVLNMSLPTKSSRTLHCLTDVPSWICHWTWYLKCLWLHRSSRPHRGPVSHGLGSGSCPQVALCPDTRRSAAHRNTPVSPQFPVFPIPRQIFWVSAPACRAALTCSSFYST